MTYEKIRADIKALSEKKFRLVAHSEAAGRELTSKENALIVEMDGAIEALTKELPNDPLTLVGPQQSIRRGGTGPQPYNSFGEQVLSIVRAQTPGGIVDPRLRQIQAAATGLNETVPSEGSFLVQQDFSTALLRSGYETGLISGRCNRFPISPGKNGIKLPAIDETSRATGSRWGGIRSYWTSEAGEKIKSKPTFRLMDMTLKKLIGLCYVTDELLEDVIALEAFLRQAFADEIGFQVDDAIIRGTGAGQPLGILNAGCLVSVTKETGQPADTLMLENIVKMFSRMPARNRRTAVWYINQEIEPQLFTMSLSVGTGGGPVYLPAGGVSDAPYGSLMGRPVIPIEQASALGDLGDIMFIDPMSYILIDKGAIQTDVSIHLRFDYDESVLRFVFRTDGQPMYASAITPYKGANDLSPFVALEAR